MPDQLYLMLLPTKFVFVAVHPPRAADDAESLLQCSRDWRKARKKILTFATKNPFGTFDDAGKMDFFGAVAFELEFKDIRGMEYSNVLVKDSSRIVFEARRLSKATFGSLDTLLEYYGFDQENRATRGYYVPRTSQDKTKFLLKKVYPFDAESSEAETQTSACDVSVSSDDVKRCTSNCSVQGSSDKQIISEVSGITQAHDQECLDGSSPANGSANEEIDPQSKP